MICFWPPFKNSAKKENFEFVKDFNLSVVLNFDKKFTQLKKGVNLIETNLVYSTITYDKMKIFRDYDCHKLSSDKSDFQWSSFSWAAVKIQFGKSIPKNELPDLNIYVTSENNSYGRTIFHYPGLYINNVFVFVCFI